MDIQELESIWQIDREIRDYLDKIEELERIATSTSPVLSDMPKGTGRGDKVGRCAVAIADYKSMLETAIAEKTVKSMKAHEYILGVEDIITRRCMYCRFIKRMTWRGVALSIGGGNTEDGCRKRVTRYIETH